MFAGWRLFFIEPVHRPEKAGLIRNWQRNESPWRGSQKTDERQWVFDFKTVSKKKIKKTKYQKHKKLNSKEALNKQLKSENKN